MQTAKFLKAQKTNTNQINTRKINQEIMPKVNGGS